MEIQFGPNSEDEPKLLYKLQRKLKVFNTDSLPNRGYNLVACASKYGILFVASPDAILSVYYLKDLMDKECEVPPHLSIKLQEQPTHIAVSCDFELLAVTGGQILNVYNVANFQNLNVQPSVSIRCEVGATSVTSLQWNPCIPDTIALAFFDGTLLISQVSTHQVKKIQAKARCVCWSPKGKQLVVGNSDGTLYQYKPDLTPAKSIPAPNLFQGAPVEALAVYWVSTYQFAVVYRNSSDDSRPVVTIINTPKVGQSSCLNYDDICYSMGSSRPWYYYLLGVAQWNMILASSSNSMEIATLGSIDAVNWIHWCQMDEARPELPLTDKKQENYPVGLCFDTCAIHQLPWGENDTLPHMPLLHVVSHSGLLTIFNVVNLRSSTQICAPPIQLVLPAAGMTTDIPGPIQIEQPPPAAIFPENKVHENVQAPHPPIYGGSSGDQSQTASMSGAPIKVPTYSVPQPNVAGPNQITKPEVKQFTPESSQDYINVTDQTHVQPSTPKPQEMQNISLAPAQEFKTNDLKLDQGKANEKLNQELKTMLIKEVNDFQMELYKYMQKTREINKQVAEDINSIQTDPDLLFMDAEKLKQDCSLEELRGTIVRLKLDLVRACAVVAEARSHTEAKDLYMWNQADPLSTKRLESIKKLAYYIQNQLDQAYKALEYKWNKVLTDPISKKPVQMLRPILDDVYQPLVKQQEILSRQEAILKTFRNTLNECDLSPMWKSNSLLRNTPFRNKDPLSKLTKNVLNMSIDNSTKLNETKLSPHKLDALRDMLANHKTVKIKPVNVELRQHLSMMRSNYEKNLKQKGSSENQVQFSVITDPQTQLTTSSNSVTQKSYEAKPDVVKVISSITQSSGIEHNTNTHSLASVTRKLFTEEIKEEKQPIPVTTVPKQIQIFSANVQPTAAPINTPSVLKDLLQKKTEVKNDANTFMGQQICSPTISVPASKNKSAVPTIFSGNQSTAGLFSQSMFPFTQTVQLKTESANAKSAETGEAEDYPKETSIKQPLAFSIQPIIENPTSKNVNIVKPESKPDKPVLNISSVKPTVTSQSNVQNVPDILNSNNVKTLFGPQSTKNNIEAKSVVNISPETKPNIQGKPAYETVQPVLKLDISKKEPDASKQTHKENEVSKPVLVSPSTATLTATSNTTDTKTESPQISPEVRNSTASALFASANASVPKSPEPVIGSPILQTPIFGSPTSSPASSIFGTANAKTPLTTTDIGSKFGTVNVIVPSSSSATTTQTISIFGSSVTSSQALSSTPTPTATSTQPPVFETPTNSASGSPVLTAPVTTQTEIFSTSATTASQSIFSTSVTTTQSSVFGSPTSNTQPSVFGGMNAGITQKSIFGTPTTSSQAVFGTSPTKSLFGNAVTTTQTPLFGTPTVTTAASIFGGTTTQTSIFGSSSPTTTSSTQSIFGAPIVTTASGTSIFGTPSPTTTQSSIFGTPSPATTQSSIFGTPTATTTSGTSIFGTSESNLFAAASISTTSAPSQSSPSNIFGGSGATSNVFGGGTSNIFGGKPSFGQSNNAPSIFGGQSAFGQQQQQQPTQNSLWAGNTGSSFGSSFGQQNQASSVFGGGASFSSSTGQAFGNPTPPSPGSQGSVFGSPQQPSSGFGGSPVFGTKPAFGQSSGFGGSPTGGGGGFGSFGGFNKSPSSGFGAPASFGTAATFGNTSPGKAFGSSSPTGFGSPNQSNATFESLATQNTLTFGNLAQQSVPQAAPSFNTSPSFTGWRG